jgi:hypothetical protein
VERNKNEEFKSVLETLEELLDTDWSEAEEFLNNLDEIFWKDNVYSISIIDKLSYYFGEMDDYDLDAFIPDYFWEDRKNALDAIDIIAESHCFNIGSYVPSYLWEDDHASLYIMKLDYTGLRYVSDKLSNYKKIVCYALSTLEEKIEESYHMSPVLPWDSRKHLEWFMKDVSEALKDDKDFILELLAYDYFSDVFDVIYNWIDDSLWNDKEFVIDVIKVCGYSDELKEQISEPLLNDPDIKKLLDDF